MHTVTVHHANQTTQLTVPDGANLRHTLLEAGLTPYTRITRRANCGGRGLCATCGVWLDNPPDPDHWHDRAAARFGYPRLSCQITVHDDLNVHLIDDKLIWGARRSRDARQSE